VADAVAAQQADDLAVADIEIDAMQDRAKVESIAWYLARCILTAGSLAEAGVARGAVPALRNYV
jgi:hypothetical protein